MDNLMTIALEAHSNELNHHRRYEIVVGRDLFGGWTVSIGYGRAGQQLRSLRFGGQDERVMQRVVRERLRRRLSAPKRIGCAYRLSSVSTAQGFAAGAWLPAETIGRFMSTDTGQDRSCSAATGCSI